MAYNHSVVGMWRSLVARIVRDDEAAGSNPVIPTTFESKTVCNRRRFFSARNRCPIDGARQKPYYKVKPDNTQ